MRLPGPIVPPPVNPQVPGSSPGRGAKFENPPSKDCGFFVFADSIFCCGIVAATMGHLSADAPAISAAFKIPKPAANHPTYWAGDAGGEYTVVILHDVREATPGQVDNTVRENLKQGALRTNAENEFKAFVEELKKNAQIERKADAEVL